jgi:hypothetical protein
MNSPFRTSCNTSFIAGCSERTIHGLKCIYNLCAFIIIFQSFQVLCFEMHSTGVGVPVGVGMRTNLQITAGGQACQCIMPPENLIIGYSEPTD